VIILGILAAIVIPQFSNATADAKKSSLTSQLQNARSQLELYKLQHLGNSPAGMTGAAGSVPAATAWAEMIVKTDPDQTINTAGQCGPYLQSAPMNPLNRSADVLIVTTDMLLGGASGSTADGWIFNKNDGKIWATSTKFTKVYNEPNANDPNNDL
jgi:type II secretory pathway pseudopilin PulG